MHVQFHQFRYYVTRLPDSGPQEKNLICIQVTNHNNGHGKDRLLSIPRLPGLRRYHNSFIMTMIGTPNGFVHHSFLPVSWVELGRLKDIYEL
jgi:hypothetical protein